MADTFNRLGRAQAESIIYCDTFSRWKAYGCQFRLPILLCTIGTFDMFFSVLVL